MVLKGKKALFPIERTRFSLSIVTKYSKHNLFCKFHFWCFLQLRYIISSWRKASILPFYWWFYSYCCTNDFTSEQRVAKAVPKLQSAFSLMLSSMGHLKMISAWSENWYADKTFKYVVYTLDTLLNILEASFDKPLEWFLNSFSWEHRTKAGGNVKQVICYHKTDHNGPILRKCPKRNLISASAECCCALLSFLQRIYVLKRRKVVGRRRRTFSTQLLKSVGMYFEMNARNSEIGCSHLLLCQYVPLLPIAGLWILWMHNCN